MPRFVWFVLLYQPCLVRTCQDMGRVRFLHGLALFSISLYLSLLLKKHFNSYRKLGSVWTLTFIILRKSRRCLCNFSLRRKAALQTHQKYYGASRKHEQEESPSASEWRNLHKACAQNGSSHWSCVIEDPSEGSGANVQRNGKPQLFYTLFSQNCYRPSSSHTASCYIQN